jgi:Xaa-Pro dipeptidase
VAIAGWDYFPLNWMSELRRKFPDKVWSDMTSAVHGIRITKTEGEIRKIEKAAGIADLAFENLLLGLVPGMKEYELIARIESFIRRSEGEDNFQLLASGSGDARAMHPPTDRAFQNGDLVITEISPRVDGYYAQICRSVVIGEASAARRKAYDVLYRAQHNAIDQVRPGMTASSLAKIQNDVFRRDGFGEYVSEKYTRGRGHGIGLYIDEEPLIAEGNEFELKTGMVIMIHPNTYLPLSGYMVLGDPVLITEKGGRRLSRSQRDLAVVGTRGRG